MSQRTHDKRELMKNGSSNRGYSKITSLVTEKYYDAETKD